MHAGKYLNEQHFSTLDSRLAGNAKRESDRRERVTARGGPVARAATADAIGTMALLRGLRASDRAVPRWARGSASVPLHPVWRVRRHCCARCPMPPMARAPSSAPIVPRRPPHRQLQRDRGSPASRPCGSRAGTGPTVIARHDPARAHAREPRAPVSRGDERALHMQYSCARHVHIAVRWAHARSPGSPAAPDVES